MSTVNGFQVGSEVLKYNYESLQNYNTPNFSSSSSKVYAIGDYVMYNGKLYKCTTATTGGTWNVNNWAEAILTDDVTEQKNAISELNRQLSDYVGDRKTYDTSNPPFNDANTYMTPGVLWFPSEVTQAMCANLPRYGVAGFMVTQMTNFTSIYKVVAQTFYYLDGKKFWRYTSTLSSLGASSWKESVSNGDEIFNQFFQARGLFDTSNPPFNDANKFYQSGTLFLPSGITQSMCANLPKYGVAGLITVEDDLFNGTAAWSQTVRYIDGSAYTRLLYGTHAAPTATSWKYLFTEKSYISVKSDGTGDYSSVVDAVNAASSGDTIVVYPGTYSGTVRAFTKTVNIIGVDKETCIIESTSGAYSNPAMEATTGHFANLTFKSRYVSGTSEEIPNNVAGAYAVHCEGSMDSGYGVGKVISFSNCRLESDFFPAFGCGTSANWKAEFVNCEFISNQPVGRGTYSTDSSGSLGALYIHDAAGSTKGYSNVLIKDCIIRSTVLKNTMCIYDLEDPNNDVDLAFINNTIYSATDGFSNSIWWRGVTTPFGNNIHLVPYSHGNTETELNS